MQARKSHTPNARELPDAKVAQKAQNHRCVMQQGDTESQCHPQMHGGDSQSVLDSRRQRQIPGDFRQDGHLSTDHNPTNVVERYSLPKPPTTVPANSATASHTASLKNLGNKDLVRPSPFKQQI